MTDKQSVKVYKLHFKDLPHKGWIECEPMFKIDIPFKNTTELVVPKSEYDKVAEIENDFQSLLQELKDYREALEQITLMLCMYSEGGSEDLGQAKGKAIEVLNKYKGESNDSSK